MRKANFSIGGKGGKGRKVGRHFLRKRGVAGPSLENKKLAENAQKKEK